jgi:CarboxypepD_reg-like domain
MRPSIVTVHLLVVAMSAGLAQLPVPRLTPSSPSRPIAVVAAQVVDDETGAPLSAVIVRIAGSEFDLVSDSLGRFAITSRHGGDVTLALRRVGYRPVSATTTLSLSDTARVSFFLHRVQILDTVNVTAPPVAHQLGQFADFERRRAHALNGVFLTRADIDRRHAVRSTSLFIGLAGVRVVDSAGIKLLASARGGNPRMLKADLAPCYLAVGVNGVVLDWGFSVDDIVPDDIEAIEVYSGPASMPRELMASRLNGFCGVAMIWTRAR